MSERDPKSHLWAGYAEAFSIFARYSPPDSSVDDVCAIHDELLAGPDVGVVSEADKARLKKLGWSPCREGGWRKFT